MKNEAQKTDYEKYISNDEPVLIIEGPMDIIAKPSIHVEVSEKWLDSCVKNTTKAQPPISYRTSPADAIARSIFG